MTRLSIWGRPVRGDGAVHRRAQTYHAQTAPNDWLEALIKAYVGDGIADDFYARVRPLSSTPADRALVLDVLHDSRYTAFAADEIRAAIATDPKVASPLSMWARRLVGEAMSQALRISADRPALVALVAAPLRKTSHRTAAVSAMLPTDHGRAQRADGRGWAEHI